jgi:hypothetical protein
VGVVVILGLGLGIAIMTGLKGKYAFLGFRIIIHILWVIGAIRLAKT